MIQSILQKSLDSLKAENPDLSYVRGMLEVLLAMQGDGNSTVAPTVINKPKVFTNFDSSFLVDDLQKKPIVDEATILEATAVAAMKTMKPLQVE